VGPELATVHVFGVPGGKIPAAFWRTARDGRTLRSQPGLTFGRVLGTSHGTTFSLRDSDLRHWVIVSSWTSTAAAEDFERSSVVRAWSALASERLRVRLRPLSARGTWGGVEAFGRPDPSPVDGRVASITRARLAPRKAVQFWRAVPAVAADLAQVDGVQLAIGIGEAPVGFQGTFSIWESAQATTEFAYRRPAHQVAIRRTEEEHWYAEELFARFAVLDVEGTYAGRTP
jgi:hypothetical protein